MSLVIAAESYSDLLRSAPHWGFELTLEALTGIVVYPFIRWAHQQWEARVHREIDAEHGVEHHDHTDRCTTCGQEVSPRLPG